LVEFNKGDKTQGKGLERDQPIGLRTPLKASLGLVRGFLGAML